jgi:hypothetical protein
VVNFFGGVTQKLEGKDLRDYMPLSFMLLSLEHEQTLASYKGQQPSMKSDLLKYFQISIELIQILRREQQHEIH